MSEEANVGIDVLRPANPLAPLPEANSEVRAEDIDALLLRLPERPSAGEALLDLQGPAPSAEAPAVARAAASPETASPETASPAGTAKPIAVRVGVATPKKGRIRRSRVRRVENELGTPVEQVRAAEAAPPAPATNPQGKAASAEKGLAKNAHERVRHLSTTEQQKVARNGELADRVALERMYGKAVWETLLQNPKLTPPEVLRIARMAGLPMPLLETIVGNRAWLSSPQIRRALLANRRLTKDMIATILRLTPKAELRLMHKQMAYPAIVREAAAKLLK